MSTPKPDARTRLLDAGMQLLRERGYDATRVEDLCTAHWLALQSLMAGADSKVYNLGNGNGFSVQEVIDTASLVTGRHISVIDAPRRAGDPARLVADARLAREKLGWHTRFADLATIIEHAWAWERSIVK